MPNGARTDAPRVSCRGAILGGLWDWILTPNMVEDFHP